MFALFSFHQFVSAFIIIFAIINIIGAIPVIVNLKKRGKTINPSKASFLSLIVFFLFFYGGEAFLSLFGIDLSSFAIAGSLIIFIVAMEMILDVEIFKSSIDSPKDNTFIPVVFPLVAGAGSLTTILSIRSQYADINILLAIICNVLAVYIVLKTTKQIEKHLGAGLMYIFQKFFGIILLAISVKLFTINVTRLIVNFPN